MKLNDLNIKMFHFIDYRIERKHSIKFNWQDQIS